MPEKLFVAVKSAIVIEDKILLLKESRNGKLSYDLPGGRVDPGEGPIEALKRELFEEIGVQTSNVSELPVAVWNEQRDDPFIFLLYMAELESDEYVLEKNEKTEVVSAEYYSLEEIEAMDNFVRKDDRINIIRKLLT